MPAPRREGEACFAAPAPRLRTPRQPVQPRCTGCPRSEGASPPHDSGPLQGACRSPCTAIPSSVASPPYCRPDVAILPGQTGSPRGPANPAEGQPAYQEAGGCKGGAAPPCLCQGAEWQVHRCPPGASGQLCLDQRNPRYASCAAAEGGSRPLGSRAGPPIPSAVPRRRAPSTPLPDPSAGSSHTRMKAGLPTR